METNKICPICESEYFPEVQMCPDCNVALQWAKPSVDPRKPDPEVWERLQPGDVLGQVTRDGNEVVEAYLGHLQAAGIEAGVLPLTRYQQAGEFDEDLHRSIRIRKNDWAGRPLSEKAKERFFSIFRRRL